MKRETATCPVPPAKTGFWKRVRAGLLALGSSYSPRLPGLAASGTRGFRPRSQWRGRGGFLPPSLRPRGHPDADNRQTL